jgi:hypothetical protein
LVSIVPAIPLDFPGFLGEFPEAIVVIDVSTERIVNWNAAGERLFRFSHSATTDHTPASLTSKDASAKLSLAVGQVIRPVPDPDSAGRFSFLASRKGLDPKLVEATLSQAPGTSSEQPLVLALIR